MRSHGSDVNEYAGPPCKRLPLRWVLVGTGEDLSGMHGFLRAGGGE